MSILGLDIPEYNEADNLTKLAEHNIVDWTIKRKDVLALDKEFKAKRKGVKKKRILVKKRNSTAIGSTSGDDKTKIIKLENGEVNGIASDKNKIAVCAEIRTNRILNDELKVKLEIKNESKCVSVSSDDDDVIIIE